MLWTVALILLILWLLGLLLTIGGTVIHLLLVAGVMVAVVPLTGSWRRRGQAARRGSEDHGHS